MKHLKSYRIFESSLAIGSMSEEFYDLFIDYAEKYDLHWVPEDAIFGWDDNISEFTIAEDNTCCVLDIRFQKGYGLAAEKNGGKISEEFHNSILEFANKIKEFTGYIPTIKHEWNCRDYKGTRLYQIAIDKNSLKESFDIKSIEGSITDIFSDLTDTYPISIKYKKSIDGIIVELEPDWKLMSASNLKLAAIEIEKLKIFTQKYIPGITIVSKHHPSLKDRFSFFVLTKKSNILESLESDDEGIFDYHNTIKDILQDCEDIGLYIETLDPHEMNLKLKNGSKKVEAISVLVEHNPFEDSNIIFKFKDIKDSICHLIEYMKQIGYGEYLYQDQYTEFNYPMFTDIPTTPNILPNDNDGIAVIKMTFFRKISNQVFDSFTYKGINYKYEWAMANSSIRKEIEVDINNMLLDAKDLNYAVSTGWVGDPYVWIGKAFRRRTFEMEEVSGTIDRINEFLISEGFETKLSEVKGRDDKPTQIYLYFNYKD